MILDSGKIAETRQKTERGPFHTDSQIRLDLETHGIVEDATESSYDDSPFFAWGYPEISTG